MINPKTMAQLLPIAPPAASTVAHAVDRVFAIELIVSVLVMLLVGGLLVGFAIAFPRRSPEDSPKRIPTHYGLEAFWTGATFLLFSGFFFLGAGLYVHMKRPPLHAQRVFVVGKQWMWKIQHESTGIREINQLHVPVGEPTELIMTSEDVIHDFFVPAFRMKQDVIPGSYTSEWFTATLPGTYHLFCAQYCGTNHASMIGEVIVLSREDYDRWQAGVGAGPSPVDAGRTLMASYGCMSCHGQVAPSFAGLYLSQVRLNDGTTVPADEEYLRRSIVDANAQIVAGFQPIMPSYRGQLTPEQVNTLVAYIKLLGTAKSTAAAGPADDDASLTHRLQNFPPAQGRPDVAPPSTKAPN